MKTTMTACRLATTLPAVRRLAVTLLRRPVEPAPGLHAARRSAIPLPPVTPTTNVEGNAATIAMEIKQQDDDHNLPYGGQRAAMVKRHWVPRPVLSGFAELASKVRSCLLRTFTCFYPNDREMATAAGNNSGCGSGSFYGKI